MDMSARVQGLDSAMEAMAAAFPADAKVQRQILTGAMRRSAAQTILKDAKQRALESDGSGALSEALGIRNRSRRAIKTARTVAGVEITPIRSNLKAMAMYINHYYTARGRTPKSGMLLSGIRHGHLVEFGSVNNTPRPFLWPAAQSSMAPYMQRLAAEMRHQIDQRVRRAASKNRGESRSGRIR
jgi:hypothetical protein